MCRDNRRCKVDKHTTNSRRRDLYAVKTSTIMLDKTLKEQGQEWAGDVKGIGFKINSPLIAKAYAIAVDSHAGVKRKSGEVYLNHPLRVAKKLQELGFNDEVVAVALMHDAVEDSNLTLSQLRRKGFNDRIVTGVDSVTKREGEEYPETIERAKNHPLGRPVKLADNGDNSSEEQLAPFDDARKAKQRAKYTPARITLVLSIKNVPHDAIVKDHPSFATDYKIKNDISNKDELFG